MREVYYKGRYYQGSLSDANAEAICNLLQQKSVESLRHEIFDLSAEDITELISKYEASEKEHGFVKMGAFAPKEKPVGTLRDEQTIGVGFMYLNGSCLLGDEVGLGKTVQIAGLINIVRKQKALENKPFSFLFLSEKTSVEQLRSKLVQFTGDFVGLLPSAEAKYIDRFVSSRDTGSDYSLVATHAALENNAFLKSISDHRYDMLIFDESAPLRNTNTGMYMDAKALVSLFPNVIFLNATPVEINALDIYNQLALIDKNLLPTKRDFESTFCKRAPKPGKGYEIVGYKNTDVFKTAISLRYLARTRKDLGGTFSDNEYKIVIAELTETQHKLLRKTTLHQLCYDYPKGVDRYVAYNAETCGKVRVLMDILDELDVKTGKAIIYVKYKECQAELAELIKEKGYSCAVINGGVQGKKRSQIITDANAGKYDVIITNIYRAYDLPAFINCIFYTIDTNPQHMIQFEGRITRDINISGKRVYMIFTAGKELAALETLRVRMSASQNFTTTGRSMVSQAILNSSEKERRDMQSKADLDRLLKAMLSAK